MIFKVFSILYACTIVFLSTVSPTTMAQASNSKKKPSNVKFEPIEKPSWVLDHQEEWLNYAQYVVNDATLDVYRALSDPRELNNAKQTFYTVFAPRKTHPQDYKYLWEQKIQFLKKNKMNPVSFYGEIPLELDDRIQFFLRSYTLSQPKIYKINCGKRIEVWELNNSNYTEPFYFIFYKKGDLYKLWEPENGLSIILNSYKNALNPNPNRALLNNPTTTQLTANELSENFSTNQNSCSGNVQFLEKALFQYNINLSKVLLSGTNTNNSVSTHSQLLFENQKNQLLDSRALSIESLYQRSSCLYNLGFELNEIEAPTIQSFSYHSSSRIQTELFILPKKELFQTIDNESFKIYNFEVCFEIYSNARTMGYPKRQSFNFNQNEIENEIPFAVSTKLRAGEYDAMIYISQPHSQKAYKLEVKIKVPSSSEVFQQDGNSSHIITSTNVDLPDTTRFLNSSVGSALPKQNSKSALHIKKNPLNGIHILPFSREVYTKYFPINVQINNEEIKYIRYLINDKEIMTRKTPVSTSPRAITSQLTLKSATEPSQIIVQGLSADQTVLVQDSLYLNIHHEALPNVEFLTPLKSSVVKDSTKVILKLRNTPTESIKKIEFHVNNNISNTPVYLFSNSSGIYVESSVNLPLSSQVAVLTAKIFFKNSSKSPLEAVLLLNDPSAESIDVNMVELLVTLEKSISENQNFEPSKFQVYENKVKQEVSQIVPVSELPLNINLAIDNSYSMYDKVKLVQDSANQFIEELLADKERANKISLTSFSRHISHLVHESTDMDIIKQALLSLYPDNSTRFYDAIIEVLNNLSSKKGPNVVIILSDGQDSQHFEGEVGSRFKYEDLLDVAQKSNAIIYAVGVGIQSKKFKQELDTIAKATNGEFMPIHHISELGTIYDKIKDDLKNKLFISYYSNITENVFRNLVIKSKNTKVKHKPGYFPR